MGKPDGQKAPLCLDPLTAVFKINNCFATVWKQKLDASISLVSSLVQRALEWGFGGAWGRVGCDGHDYLSLGDGTSVPPDTCEGTWHYQLPFARSTTRAQNAICLEGQWGMEELCLWASSELCPAWRAKDGKRMLEFRGLRVQREGGRLLLYARAEKVFTLEVMKVK